MVKRPKQPKAPAAKPAAKVPRIAPPGPNGERPPLRWSFARFDDHASWQAHPSNVCGFCEALGKLKGYEQRPVTDFLGHSKRDHPLPISELTPEAQQQLLNLGIEEVDELYRIRFNGRQRLWGMLFESVFFVLWWDPEHRVCLSTR